MTRLLTLLTVVLATASSRAADRRPNVVFILTDNHGAWTLGCYRNRDIRTRNLDRLAGDPRYDLWRDGRSRAGRRPRPKKS